MALNNLDAKISTSQYLSGSPKKVIGNASDIGKAPCFFPEIIDLRIIRPRSDEIWTNGPYTSLSAFVEGKTKGGVDVSIVYHLPHYYSVSANYIDTYQNLDILEGELPTEAFHSMVQDDGRKDGLERRAVWVFDREQLNKLGRIVRSVDEALENPLYVSILGGEHRVKEYFSKLEQYGRSVDPVDSREQVISQWIGVKSDQKKFPRLRLFVIEPKYNGVRLLDYLAFPGIFPVQ